MEGVRGVPSVSEPPLSCVAGGLKVGVEGVEVIWQAVCGTDGSGGGPIVCMCCRPCHIRPETAVE